MMIAAVIPRHYLDGFSFVAGLYSVIGMGGMTDGQVDVMLSWLAEPGQRSWVLA